jgi:hypothetical protein
MTTQAQLFYEDIYDVLRAAVQAIGGTKAVAGRLWPHKPISEAQRELLDALNRDRPRKLDAEEVLAVLRMAKEAGFHQAKHWVDSDLGYQPSQPLDPKIERDRLADELARAAETFKGLQRAVERLHAVK